MVVWLSRKELENRVNQAQSRFSDDNAWKAAAIELLLHPDIIPLIRERTGYLNFIRTSGGYLFEYAPGLFWSRYEYPAKAYDGFRRFYPEVSLFTIDLLRMLAGKSDKATFRDLTFRLTD